MFISPYIQLFHDCQESTVNRTRHFTPFLCHPVYPMSQKFRFLKEPTVRWALLIALQHFNQ
jgi:hypothetical protein